METDQSQIISRKKNALTKSENRNDSSSNKNVYFISNHYSDAISCQVIDGNNNKSSSRNVLGWRRHMIRLSNCASILCVIDCTVFPILTLVLSALGIVDGNDHDSHLLDWLHELGHAVALYFVLPVGSTTAIFGYFSHQKIIITVAAFLGLCLIALSNMGHPNSGKDTGEWFLFHLFHEGQTHQLSNIIGCCLLLWSNQQSRRMHTCKDKNCERNNTVTMTMML
mmetsp:Transcript_5962/g.8682  ORF Transcript_5962/g.8682 Transcript_5962/m.8682 type:complete len:224 (+) Transcript_5962:49-720(+)